MAFSGGNITYKQDGKTNFLDFTKSLENDDFILGVSITGQDEESRAAVTLTPKRKITLLSCNLFTKEKIKDSEKVLLNGYQTWTDSREFSMNETIPKINPLIRPIMSMYGDYNIVKYSRDKLTSFTYTYIRRDASKVTLYGSMSEKDGYTIFEYSKKDSTLTVIKDCAGFEPQPGVPYRVFNIFSQTGEENAVFDNYFYKAGFEKPKVKPCTGWTSWYNYYTNVTEKDVLDNLEAFASRSLPIDIFQIDDGYQNAVGDWLLINNKFPNGMTSVAQKIHEKGVKAGLWLAPIICEKKSELYKNHPDWVSVKAGINPGWSGIFYCLDFYNPEVQAYLREVFDTVLNKWHYDMVKLDFLYAACLPPRRDKTRGQVMYEFMKFLREISGDKIILGCGVPLGCAFSLVDYCRVSSDVALKWEDKTLTNLHYRERVSTINALTSTIGRHDLNGRAFYNDPDVFILRDENNELTEDQKYTLFMINSVLGGLVFTSDNVSLYNEKQMALYKTLFKLKDAQVKSVSRKDYLEICFSLGEESFTLLSNLTDAPKTCISPADGTFEEIEKVKAFEELELRPFQSILIKHN